MQKGNEKEKMFLMIEGWKKSGQSQQAYCKGQGIRYHIFHYWYKIYRDEQQTRVSTESSFVQLQVQQETAIPATTTSIPINVRLCFHLFFF